MPAAVAATFDDPFGLFEPSIFDDPYPAYHVLRHADPVHWCVPVQSWLVTRYDDAYRVLSDRRFASGLRRAAATSQLPEDLRRRMIPIDAFISKWLMNIDAPEHILRRVPLNKLFAKPAVDRLAGQVTLIANRLIDHILKVGGCDLIEDFAQPLPVAVIAAMVGIPHEDYAKLFGWFARMTNYFELGATRPAVLEGMTTTIAEMDDYFDALLERRRRNPEDDMLTRLLALEGEHESFGRQWTRATLALLLFAGHESTRATFGNGLLALLRRPAAMDRLRDDPRRLERAIEEMLRFDGPFMRLDRVASADLELGGRRIAAGDRVVLILGAANRDPAKFSQPDVFDIDRADIDHLAFGHGEHFCLGARLARVELTIGFELLLRRLPQPRLAAAVVWRRHFNHRGLRSMPLTLGHAVPRD
jgi:cytochrome P450